MTVLLELVLWWSLLTCALSVLLAVLVLAQAVVRWAHARRPLPARGARPAVGPAAVPR